MALADTARLIASLELQDKFSGPAKRAEGSIGGLDRKVSSLGQVGQRASRGLGSLATNVAKLGVAAGALTIGAAVVGITASISAASDLNEEIDKSKVVFGDAADEILRFSENAASGTGLAQSEALGAAGAFGNMLRTIGLSQDSAAEMSRTMVILGADMASFNNEDPSEMLDRLRSGLAGEAEPLRRFGVLISEATVNEFAYANGIAETGEKLTEAQKVQARYGVILRDTNIQQGNFQTTSASLANQQRILRANLSNTAATMGQNFLPIAAKLVQKINELFVDKQPQIERFGRRVGRALDNLFSNENMDTGIAKIGGLIDKVSGFDPGKFKIDFGDENGQTANIASSIGTIAESVKGLPWESIGNAARLLGTGSKALLDAFLGLPPWVQTAVLTGWGLNKLTGGALTGIVGALASGLVKGILGINAGVVNINAGTVTGGGGGLPSGGRGGLVGGVVGGLAAGVGVGLAAVAAVKVVEFTGDANAQAEDLRSSIEALPNQTAGELNDSLAAIERAQQAAIDGPLSGIVTELFGVQYDLKTNKTELINTRNDLARNIVRGTDATTRSVDRVNSSVALERAAQQAIAAADAARIQRLTDSHNSANAYLQQIRDKPTSFTANVTTSIQLSASAVAINLQRVTQTTNVRPDINEVVL